MSVVSLKQVFRVLGGIVETEKGVCSKTNLVVRDPCADATVLLEIMHFRQTCERTGIHIYVAFGAIPEMSVPDGRRASMARQKNEDDHTYENFSILHSRCGCNVPRRVLDSCNETLLFPRLKRRGGVV